MGFEFVSLDLKEVILVKPDTFSDNRGYFREIYKESVFSENGIKDRFRQLNFSFSEGGVIRGLHYQIEPYPQAKLVRCVKGKIFDVAVDVRKNSPTLGKWVSVELSDENGFMLYVPYGFAHGFAVLSDNAMVEYFVSHEYCRECEKGILFSDKTIGIDWPVANPIVSEKDKQLPTFDKAFLI